MRWLACALLLSAGCFDLDRFHIVDDASAVSDGSTRFDASLVRDQSASVDLLDLSPGAPSTCVALGTTVELCDPFDAIQDWWSTREQGGSDSVDVSRPYRGATSLHVVGNSQDMTTTATATLTMNNTNENVPSGVLALPLYARFWMYMSSESVYTDGRIFSVQSYGDASIAQQVLVSLNPSGELTLAVAPGSPVKQQTPPFPTDAWTCVQLAIDGDSATVVVNEATENMLSVSVSGFAPTSLVMGWYNDNKLEGHVELWQDELIIDDHPVSCSE